MSGDPCLERKCAKAWHRGRDWPVDDDEDKGDGFVLFLLVASLKLSEP